MLLQKGVYPIVLNRGFEGWGWTSLGRRIYCELPVTGLSMAKCHKVDQYLGKFWWVLKLVMAFSMFPRL